MQAPPRDLLRDVCVVNLFFEASTRTYTSFAIAEQTGAGLGASFYYWYSVRIVGIVAPITTVSVHVGWGFSS